MTDASHGGIKLPAGLSVICNSIFIVARGLAGTRVKITGTVRVRDRWNSEAHFTTGIMSVSLFT